MKSFQRQYDVILVITLFGSPATFLLLASMSLFRLFCLIYNKKQQKFCYVHDLTYLKQEVVQSHLCNLQITVLRLYQVGK